MAAPDFLKSLGDFMETILVIIIAALAVGYLYRYFSRAFKNRKNPCPCHGCGARCVKPIDCGALKESFGTESKRSVNALNDTECFKRRK